MRARPEVMRVALELAGVLETWELVLWIVTPSVWLGDERPVDHLFADTRLVHAAARADRYVAAG